MAMGKAEQERPYIPVTERGLQEDIFKLMLVFRPLAKQALIVLIEELLEVLKKED